MNCERSAASDDIYARISGCSKEGLKMDEKQWREQQKKEVFKCSGCGTEKPLTEVHWTVAKNVSTGKWFSFQCDECNPAMKRI